MTKWDIIPQTDSLQVSVMNLLREEVKELERVENCDLAKLERRAAKAEESAVQPYELSVTISDSAAEFLNDKVG